jgi:hypothetical protein
MYLIERLCPQCSAALYRDVWLEGECPIPAADSEILCFGCGWRGAFGATLDGPRKPKAESEYSLDYQI